MPEGQLPHDRSHGGGLAHAVTTLKADALPLGHIQAQIEEHLAGSVATADIA